jgi:CRP/FNR family transcriptional regulator, cyclic AMP receptor protein
MSACRDCQPQKANFVRLIPGLGRSFPSASSSSKSYRGGWNQPSRADNDLQPAIPQAEPETTPREAAAVASTHADVVDPLYLLACQVEWERRADPSSAWEVVSAANSSHEDTRAHARSLLANSRRNEAGFCENNNTEDQYQRGSRAEASMKTPYGLEIIESCVGCKLSQKHFFCGFSPTVLRSVDVASRHSILPAGAILFVEGQTPRGIYILCSGKVTLSTTSKEGKVLILKQAEAGEVLGLSAAVSGMNYEMTGETATPCQLNFVSRTDLMNLLQCESEVGVHASQWLSRDFQAAYRDIRDLVLARSSAGKLARLLLSCAPGQKQESDEFRLRSPMTHEEMAQRIGSSRETVTRLLSDLKKKRLIRLEGATLVIRDRPALEALAV